MDQMQVMALSIAFTDELFGHVGDDVVLLGMHRHDAPVPGHFGKHRPQVAIGHTETRKGRKNFKTGNALLHRFANLAEGCWGDTAGENVVEGKVRIGMAAKDLAPAVDLCRDGLWGWLMAQGRIEIASEVDDGRHPSKSRSAAGCFRRLGHHFRTSSPPLGHRNSNMGVRLNAARQYNVALRLDDPGRLCRQGARRGDRNDGTILDPDIALSHLFWGDHQATANDQIEHRPPPYVEFRNVRGRQLAYRVPGRGHRGFPARTWPVRWSDTSGSVGGRHTAEHFPGC